MATFQFSSNPAYNLGSRRPLAQRGGKALTVAEYDAAYGGPMEPGDQVKAHLDKAKSRQNKAPPVKPPDRGIPPPQVGKLPGGAAAHPDYKHLGSWEPPTMGQPLPQPKGRTMPNRLGPQAAGLDLLSIGTGIKKGFDFFGGLGKGLGKSRCPGPYNYDPATGGCVPKNQAGYGAGPCPSGYEWKNGKCQATGLGSALERWVPGGETGTLADDYGEAVVGAFGKPALMPAVAGQVAKRDGTTGPILRCPRGTVLGKDNLCYPKGSITNANRKWPKPTKAPITAADMRMLSKISTLQGRIEKAAVRAGYLKPKLRK